jgi:hypothetical protein
MATIKIRSSVKTLDVEWPNGKKTTLSFSCGNVESAKLWIGKAGKIEEIAKRIDSENAIDEVVELAREVITMLVGAKWWSKLYKLADHNIFAVMEIVTALSTLMSEGIKENAKH